MSNEDKNNVDQSTRYLAAAIFAGAVSSSALTALSPAELANAAKQNEQQFFDAFFNDGDDEGPVVNGVSVADPAESDPIESAAAGESDPAPAELQPTESGDAELSDATTDPTQ